MSPFATKEYVDDAIAALPETNLSSYATKSYVDNAVESIPEVNLTPYATIKYVDNAISGIDIPDVNLTPYATIKYVDNVVDGIELPDLSGYATQSYVKNAIAEAELNEKDVDLSGLASKDDIPTKTSQLVNDSKFITLEDVPQADVDLDDYATKEWVDEKLDELVLEGVEVDLNTYAKKSEIPDVSNFITEVPAEYVTDNELNSKGYATQSYVTTKIAEAQLSGDGEPVDLSGFATKDDLNGLATEDYVDNAIANIEITGGGPTKTSQLENDSGFITSIPSEYVTDTELNAKGYLTQHQSLDGKADKVHSHPEYLTEHQSLAAYATKTYVDTAISNIEITGGSGDGKIKVVFPCFDSDMDHSDRVLSSKLQTQVNNIIQYMLAGNTDILQHYEIYQKLPERYEDEVYTSPRSDVPATRVEAFSLDAGRGMYGLAFSGTFVCTHTLYAFHTSISNSTSLGGYHTSYTTFYTFEMQDADAGQIR